MHQNHIVNRNPGAGKVRLAPSNSRHDLDMSIEHHFCCHLYALFSPCDGYRLSRTDEIIPRIGTQSTTAASHLAPRPVLNRLGQVRGLDALGADQVGDLCTCRRTGRCGLGQLAHSAHSPILGTGEPRSPVAEGRGGVRYVQSPVSGLPVIRQLCAPAAAASKLRLMCSCPLMSAKMSAKSVVRIHNARLILARGYVVIRANTMSKCDHAKTKSPKLTLTGVSSSYAGSRRKADSGSRPTNTAA